MIDVQSTFDERGIPLQKVGVKKLSYPVGILGRDGAICHTTAQADLFVDLPAECKGTHMSRFVEVFHRSHENIGRTQFISMLHEIRKSLGARKAYGSMTFPFFMEKKAPVSQSMSLMSYTCTFDGEVSGKDEKFLLTVRVPVTTVCPCSKAISEYGAHNQRGIVTVRLNCTAAVSIEDVVAVVEQSASAGLYSILKRPDEKYVTEQAYDNPRFVEDVVREVYSALLNMGSRGEVSMFSVECENFESIHNHNAYAYTEWKV